MSYKQSKIKAAIRSLKLHDDCFAACMLPYRFIDEESRVGLDDSGDIVLCVLYDYANILK